MTVITGGSMAEIYECPLCGDVYEQPTDLRVHLEVEHRKSELARHVLEVSDGESDPTTDRPDATSPMPATSG